MHAAHGDFPVAEKVVPASHATWQIVLFVVVHDFSTPSAQVETAAQVSQGSFPVLENEAPPTHGAIAPAHTIFAPGTQAVLTPAVHVESAAHAAHGELPDADHEVPVTHGVSHTVLVVLVHAVLTPNAHVASAAQAAHGSLPVAALNEVPTTHDAGAALHSVFLVTTQAVFTP